MHHSLVSSRKGERVVEVRSAGELEMCYQTAHNVETEHCKEQHVCTSQPNCAAL